MRSKRFALGGASLCAVALVATACSSDEPKQEFSVPKALCGVAVPADALSQLLPSSGKDLSVDDEGNQADGSVLCKVAVDDHEMVLTLTGERIETGGSARDILRSRASVADPKTADDGTIAYSAAAAVSVVKCGGAGVVAEDISTLVKVLEPGRQDEAAMRDLISGYTAALEKSEPCTRES
ncbi:hypothetical protein ACIQAC_29705 [Streptomyces sp. NPDC088387]|uniref:hypothetical protein n=1 Tax=Streptomyces sp. NPDC088387 TaxID=3365859 RepID=UPI00382D64D2